MASRATIPSSNTSSTAFDPTTASNLQYQTQQYLNQDTKLGSTMTDNQGTVYGAPSSVTQPGAHLQGPQPGVAQSSAFDQDMARQPLSRTSSEGSTGRGTTLTKNGSPSTVDNLRKSDSKSGLRNRSASGATKGTTESVQDPTSVFYTPIPTTGSPCDVLAERFQNWRRFLKDLISYFRDVQATYETKFKSSVKLHNSLQNMSPPPGFLAQGGLGDTFDIFKFYHREVQTEVSKAREIQNDIISQLTGLRADLGQKVREIKGLSGDFKNSVDKEKDNTRRHLDVYRQSLESAGAGSKPMVGKEDPYIMRMAVERQVEKQLDEETYLHRAYINLESSGRELESIVVGEIQKAISAFTAILANDAAGSEETISRLRAGPISMPQDLEWTEFIAHEPSFVMPSIPIRKAENLIYPGKFHPAAVEVRAGILERKTKYLKSYTPGWYVLSTTHLHEFKSAESVYNQSPVMSLYLLDQTLGSHSEPRSSSHKFMLKGKQTGGGLMGHRGHSWAFRAENQETMLAWYEDLKALTETSPEERQAFMKGHSRTVSAMSDRSTSDLEEDEADKVPYSQEQGRILAAGEGRRPSALSENAPSRPEGGRFPSSMDANKGIRHTRESSEESDLERGRNYAAGAAGAKTAHSLSHQRSASGAPMLPMPAGVYDAFPPPLLDEKPAVHPEEHMHPYHRQTRGYDQGPSAATQSQAKPYSSREGNEHMSGGLMAGTAAGAGLAAAGAAHHHHHHHQHATEPQTPQPAPIPAQSSTTAAAAGPSPTARVPQGRTGGGLLSHPAFSERMSTATVHAMPENYPIDGKTHKDMVVPDTMSRRGGGAGTSAGMNTGTNMGAGTGATTGTSTGTNTGKGVAEGYPQATSAEPMKSQGGSTLVGKGMTGPATTGSGPTGSVPSGSAAIGSVPATGSSSTTQPIPATNEKENLVTSSQALPKPETQTMPQSGLQATGITGSAGQSIPAIQPRKPVPTGAVSTGASQPMTGAQTSMPQNLESMAGNEKPEDSYPRMQRLNTDNSISNLHMPGEFPK